MVRNPAIKTLFAGCLVLWGSLTPAWAAPTVAEMLSVKPKFADVDITTPSAEEAKACEVKLVPGTRTGSSGWLLVDARKQPLRLFFDNAGSKRIDTWSYFKDGQEVYREQDTNGNDHADQFRWIGAGGMKWGVDTQDAKGGSYKITAWRMISAEEVGEEVFEALKTRDFAHLQALFISEPEMKALKLPAPTVEALRAQQKQAQAKFQALLSKVPSLNQATMLRVERTSPSVFPPDMAGTDQDIFK